MENKKIIDKAKILDKPDDKWIWTIILKKKDKFKTE
jgi:hypothetical protein